MEPASDRVAEHSVDQFQKPAGSASGESVPAGQMLQKAAGQLSNSLGELFDAEFRVDCASACEQLASCREYPICRWALDCAEGPARLVVAGPVLHAAVDCLLGGTGQPIRRQAELTSIERRVVGRLAEKISQVIGSAVGTCFRLGSDLPEQGRFEQFDRQGRVVSFRVRLSDYGGTISLALPDNLACLLTETEPQDGPSADPSGRGPAAADAVELSVVADAADLPAEHLADLKAGDVLVTDADCEGELEVRIDGRATHSAKLGSRNGKRAITIVRSLDED